MPPKRHAPIVDHLNYAEFSDTLRQGRMASLDIGGEVIEVDTTDFDQVNLADIFAAVEAHLKR